MKRRAVSCKRDRIQILESLRRALSSGTLDGIKKLLSDQKKEDSKFNVLRVLGIDELEIRHSFMLKWLLSPKENHGLGASFLKLLLMAVIDENDAKHPGRYKALQNLRAADYKTFEVAREVANIDLLLVSQKKQIVIAIENKWNAQVRVNAETGQSQLTAYEEWVCLRYPSPRWKHYFILLTLGDQKLDSGNIDVWDTFGYESVALIMENKCIRAKLARPKFKEQEILLRHYKQILEEKLTLKDAVHQAAHLRNYRDPLLQELYDDIELRNGVRLKAEKSEATTYVQYKRRLPLGKVDSVHYEVFVGSNECKVLLHIEKSTEPDIKDELIRMVSDACKKNGFLRIVRKKESKEFELGGAEIVIRRRGRTNADVKDEICQNVQLMYEAFEPILQKFE